MRRMLPFVSLTLIVFIISCGRPTTSSAASWPRFLGPNADGISPETGINKDWGQRPPRTLWKVPLGNNGYAGPSVADGKVFIIDREGTDDVVLGLSLATGQEVWRFRYPEPVGDNYGFARATPLYDNGKLYTLSRMGMLHCLDAKTGAKIWARNIVADFGGRRPTWDMSMSPVVDGKQLIVCPGGNTSVVALDKDTGNPIWKGGVSDLPGYATPVIAAIRGKKQYVIFSGTQVSGVDPANGAALWSYPWKTGYDVNAATPLVIGNSVFITSDYGRGCALVDIAGGQASARWENKAMHSHFSTPIFYEGYIYGTTDPGFVVCLDPGAGNVKWRQPGFEKGGVVAVDGALIAVSGNTGDVVMITLTPDGYQELGRIRPLGGQSWTAPIVVDGKLIIRNRTALACLDLK